MVDYVVESLDTVAIAAQAASDGCALMSPFCWREGDRTLMMLRVVPKGGRPTGVIWAAESRDGLDFHLRHEPSISPGPESADAAGCEDPTVVRHGAGYSILYTGVRADGQGQLLSADGADLLDLTKRGTFLAAPAGEGNIKEATLARASTGDWVLWFEYAAGNASRIGCARGPSAQGPWTVVEDPFSIREGDWDRWHLSTGPVESRPGRDPVMFYNGATEDARWRIGWVTFSPDFRRITGRCVEPMIVPSPPTDRGGTDIAFAASSITEGEMIQLYYSIEDDVLMRAAVRRYD